MMSDKSLLEMALPAIKKYLEILWQRIDQPCALYARGSAVCSTSHRKHTPWDIDFIVFIRGDVATALQEVATIIMMVQFDQPQWPRLDIHVVPVVNDVSSGGFLHALILIRDGGVHLFGDNMLSYFPNPLLLGHFRDIWQYALQVTTNRLVAYKECKNIAECALRAPHLAKSVLRLAGLLKLNDGQFSRDPEECATWLQEKLIRVTDKVEILLSSLTNTSNHIELSMACQCLIYEVDQVFQRDIS